jgi:hypothetical protein
MKVVNLTGFTVLCVPSIISENNLLHPFHARYLYSLLNARGRGSHLYETTTKIFEHIQTFIIFLLTIPNSNRK